MGEQNYFKWLRRELNVEIFGILLHQFADCTQKRNQNENYSVILGLIIIIRTIGLIDILLRKSFNGRFL